MQRSIEQGTQLCLASASVQRCALLSQLGIKYLSMPMDINETRAAGEAANDYVQRLAIEKACAASAAISAALPVLGADTTVVCHKQTILEKPVDAEHAAQMLGWLSASTHRVYTGAAIVDVRGQRSAVVATAVTFKRLTAQEIDNSVATGEPFGKAGAYAIQGLGAVFIESISGSYSNVMGLPLFETAAMLCEVGIDVIGNH